MTKNKDTLLRLLQQHRQLGISDQIDYTKFYLYSLIAHSTAIEGSTMTESEVIELFERQTQSTDEKMVDKRDLQQEMVDKWSIKPTLAEKLVDILEYMSDRSSITTEQLVTHFGYTATSAKRYLRQLTDFGYLIAHGANKNRTYSKR